MDHAELNRVPPKEAEVAACSSNSVEPGFPPEPHWAPMELTATEVKVEAAVTGTAARVFVDPRRMAEPTMPREFRGRARRKYCVLGVRPASSTMVPPCQPVEDNPWVKAASLAIST